MLTRIAYQVLGMVEELPKPLSQENMSAEMGPIKAKPITMVVPPREHSKRKCPFTQEEDQATKV